jgi:predicted nuclease of predicted toxin-antitoxin system
VKLLLDENLSRRLVAALQPAYPGTSHVVLQGLEQADDRAVWAHAREHGFVIVTKDDDFSALQAWLGHPPCVIRVGLGNVRNDAVLHALLQARDRIEAVLARGDIGLIELS